jgi:hypothetical protein
MLGQIFWPSILLNKNSANGEKIMAMSVEEVEAAIIEKATKAPKPQLYIKDFYECDPERKPREIKNIANDLTKKGKLMFWSSGSTTMYAIPTRIKNEENAEGVN